MIKWFISESIPMSLLFKQHAMLNNKTMRLDESGWTFANTIEAVSLSNASDSVFELFAEALLN